MLPMNYTEEPSLQLQDLHNSSHLSTPQTHQLRQSSARTTRNLWHNARAISDVLYLFVALLIFTVLYIVFIYYVLIKGKVHVGDLFLSASTTNLLVSIFSQIFVILAAITVHGLLAALRLALKNASLVAFVGVASSSGWTTVLKLLAAGWFYDLWRNFRYALLAEGSLLVVILGIPIMCLAFGSVLKCVLSPPLLGPALLC
jgi:hypothetical protein